MERTSQGYPIAMASYALGLSDLHTIAFSSTGDKHMQADDLRVADNIKYMAKVSHYDTTCMLPDITKL